MPIWLLKWPIFGLGNCSHKYRFLEWLPLSFSTRPLSAKTGPRLLPAGWWEGVPEGFRKQFDRKILRQGYLLSLDGFVKGLVFFRNVYGATVLDGNARFICRYQHESEKSRFLHSNCECTCGSATVQYRCAHEAALLFKVFTDAAGRSISGGKAVGDGYNASIWAQLALAICRSHPSEEIKLVHRPDRTSLENPAGLEILGLEDSGDAFKDKAEYGKWAAQEILDEEILALKSMGHTPTRRAEFGPVGEVCRIAYLRYANPVGRLDWDEAILLFRIRFHENNSPFCVTGLLSNEQAYSFWKKYPQLELGDGFAEEEESWRKGLEVRVVDGSRLRIRPFAGLEARNYPASEGEGLRFGDRVFLPGCGFRKLHSGPGSLLQRYTGWKTYWVEAIAVPEFLRKHSEELASGPDYDLDPILGHPHAATIQNLYVRVHAAEGERYRVALEFHIGNTLLDLKLLKSLLESGQPCLITSAGWVDLSAMEWSWLGQVKADHWHRQEEEWHALMDAAQLTRICVMHAPERIQVNRNQVDSPSVPGLDFLETLANLACEDLIAEDSDATHLKIPLPTTGLRTYQVEGLRWLHRLTTSGLSGILADDMGLGKTHQVMALFAWLHQHSEGRDKILIICPTSVLYHWHEKIAAFHPELNAGVFHGAQRDPEILDKEICITSYGIARNDMDLFRRRNYAVLVLDEIQFSKNRDSETHQSLRDFPARSIIGLSGTPLENSVWEVKNLFDLILPGYFPGESQFRRDIADPLESGMGVEAAKNRFMRLTRPFLLRRLKSEVLSDLPEKMEETYTCDLAPDQATLYHACLKQKGGPLLRELLGQGKGLGQPSMLHIFQLLNHLKQICNHPMTLSGAAVETESNFKFEALNKEYRSGKWELFVFLLEKSLAAGHKIVVFSQYLGMLDWIEKHLEDAGIGYAVLNGATQNRPAVLKRFASDPTCRVFCCSLKAGGVGIDLTAAETVIHYDRWWNAARENQATDRVHRFGQSKNVQVYKLITRGTIEERIDAIIRKKAAWMETLLPGDAEGGLKLFTRGELIELLRGE